MDLCAGRRDLGVQAADEVQVEAPPHRKYAKLS
jgi:hypothetical protein